MPTQSRADREKALRIYRSKEVQDVLKHIDEAAFAGDTDLLLIWRDKYLQILESHNVVYRMKSMGTVLRIPTEFGKVYYDVVIQTESDKLKAEVN